MKLSHPLALRFKQCGNPAFEAINTFYRPNCKNWHRHVSKYVRIDADSFASEFSQWLYQALIKFDPEHRDEAGQTIPFDHYFASTVRRSVNGLIRAYMSKKNKIMRKAVSLSLREHDMADDRVERFHRGREMAEAISVIVPNQTDRRMLGLRMQGCCIHEICHSLNIKRREYWTRIGKLRTSVRLSQVA